MSRDLPMVGPGLLNASRRRAAVVKTFKELIFDYTQIPEMVGFAWWLEGVPRSFFDQAVRHRKTSIFARSQRVRDHSTFADDGDYLTTRDIWEHDDRLIEYETTMKYIQGSYERLLKMGTPVEDARGLLPLHLRTGFAWGTTLRDLVEVFNKRTCHLLQQEYWGPIAQQMLHQLAKVDPELEHIFSPPCVKTGVCISPVEAQDRTRAYLVEGRKDLRPCRIWNARFEKHEAATAIKRAVDNGLIQWATSPEEAAYES
jgi:flavin-dependent thymidylate synthase